MSERYVFDTGRPIYIQIVQSIKLNIASGKWAAGERVAAVRDLAVAFGVNPNTMQRALSELERDRLMYTERTSGRFITEDDSVIQSLRHEMSMAETARYAENMTKLGYSAAETQNMLKEMSERSTL